MNAYLSTCTFTKLCNLRGHHLFRTTGAASIHKCSCPLVYASATALLRCTVEKRNTQVSINNGSRLQLQRGSFALASLLGLAFTSLVTPRDLIGHPQRPPRLALLKASYPGETSSTSRDSGVILTDKCHSERHSTTGVTERMTRRA